MRRFFALLACVCGLCFGEDSPKCKELAKWADDLKDMSREFVRNGDWEEIVEATGEAIGDIKCVEIAECGGEKYCIRYVSPSIGEVSFFDKIHHE